MYQWSVARQNGGGGVDDLEAIFLHSIPSLFRQAERNLHSDNFNFQEYLERRYSCISRVS